jgi:hypothetical protein
MGDFGFFPSQDSEDTSQHGSRAFLMPRARDPPKSSPSCGQLCAPLQGKPAYSPDGPGRSKLPCKATQWVALPSRCVHQRVKWLSTKRAPQPYGQTDGWHLPSRLGRGRASGNTYTILQ